MLEAYKEHFESIASVLTYIQILSGISLILNIQKKGSSSGFSIAPFLGGVIISTLGGTYGLSLGDSAMFKTNLFGFVINVLYSSFYYIYTPKKNKQNIWLKTGLTGFICTGILYYSSIENIEVLKFRLGIAFSAAIIAIVSSPLLLLPEIIRNKDVGELSFPIIFSGVLLSISWLLYGLSIHNSMIMASNFILLTLGLAQLLLFVIYPKKSVASKTKIQ